jgi:hypothetical protein
MTDRMKKTPKLIALIDAQQMAREHPDTFQAPSNDTLQDLRPGDLVKVAQITERFWVQVVERRDSGVLLGKVDNHLLTGDAACGDLIEFHECNVYEVFDLPS